MRWVWILSSVLYVAEARFSPCFEHQMSGDMEDLILVIRLWLDYEVEWFKVSWWSALLHLCVHPHEEVIVFQVNKREIGDKQKAIWLSLFGGLLQNLLEHRVSVYKSCQGIREYHTINFLTQSKGLVKNISHNQFKLVHYAKSGQVLSGSINHS